MAMMARMYNDEQHYERHERASRVLDSHRPNEDEHPGEAKEEIEQDEAQSPAADIDLTLGLGEKLPALRVRFNRVVNDRLRGAAIGRLNVNRHWADHPEPAEGTGHEAV